MPPGCAACGWPQWRTGERRIEVTKCLLSRVELMAEATVVIPRVPDVKAGHQTYIPRCISRPITSISVAAVDQFTEKIADSPRFYRCEAADNKKVRQRQK
jgi:hypothetical protein